MDALLDKRFLDELGVSLTPEAYEAFSSHYEDTLHERVAAEIVEELDEQQLAQLHSFGSKSDEELQEWLKANVPQLKDIIEDEVAILLGEIAENNRQF